MTLKEIEIAANSIAALFGENERERFIAALWKQVHSGNA